MGTAVCVIPARGGSRRLPRKNAMLFEGKPMVARAIETAQESKCFGEIIVSSDDSIILRIAARHGALPLARQWKDPDGAVGTQEVTAKVLAQVACSTRKYVCCLYPTTPLVTPLDLQVGLMHAKKSGVYFSMAAGAQPLRDAGAFYIGRAEHFYRGFPLLGIHTRLIILPEERVCDINTQEDWECATRKYRALRTKT